MQLPVAGRDVLKYVHIYSEDSYGSLLRFSDVEDMMYYAPGDYTGKLSDPPMIAYYKTTTVTENPEKGEEPAEPAKKLPTGSETYVYGQKAEVRDMLTIIIVTT